MKEPEELIGAYVPVLQQGYIDLFDRHPDATIGVFDTDILSLFRYLKKDIRALKPEIAFQAIEGIGRNARFLGQVALGNILRNTEMSVIMADDDVSRGVLHALDIHPDRVTLEPVFLRWDRQNTTVNIETEPDRVLSVHNLDPDIVSLLDEEQANSANSWRRVGAVAAYGTRILQSSHNHSVPTEFTTAIDADPRNTATRGVNIETSIDIHAESELIARMARHGHKVEGVDLYVTTFPCPNCAKLIASAGVKRVLYAEGYAMLDGESVMRSSGVELIKIDGFEPTILPNSSKPYPTAS